jgi:hypothetical protein
MIEVGPLSGGLFHIQPSDTVQDFGRRHDEAIHALRPRRPNKRQCTKSREVGTGGAAGAIEI